MQIECVLTAIENNSVHQHSCCRYSNEARQSLSMGSVRFEREATVQSVISDGTYGVTNRTRCNGRYPEDLSQ